MVFFTRKQKLVITLFITLIGVGFGWMITETSKEMSATETSTTVVNGIVTLESNIRETTVPPTTTPPVTEPPTTLPPPPPPTTQPPPPPPSTTIYRPQPTVPRTTIVYVPPSTSPASEYVRGLQLAWDEDTPEGRATLCYGYNAWMRGEQWAADIMISSFGRFPDDARLFFSRHC